MKVIGKGVCHIYEPGDDFFHAPDADDSWQESVVLYFWDPRRQVFAFLRLNQEPNREPGIATHWIHIWTPGHVYRHVATTSLNEGNVGRTHIISGDGRCRFDYDGAFHWRVNDPQAGVTLTLRLDQSHPGIGPFFVDGADYLVSQTNKHHIEASGTVAGSLTMKGETFALDGIGWRDHSWGKRDWGAVRAHRFFGALLGPEFAFFGLTFAGSNGEQFKAASIIRGDTIALTNDFDILVHLCSDGVTNAGGKVALRLEGDEFNLEFRPLTSSGVSKIHAFMMASTMCEVVMNGQTGVGVSETSNNALGGGDLGGFIEAPAASANGLFEAVKRKWA